MYLMFVDESGDTGLVGSPTDFFVLSGLVVHESRWKDVIQKLLEYRQAMKLKFGLKLREEIHASELINKPGPLARLQKHQRLEILRDFADALVSIQDICLLNVVVDKTSKLPPYDVFQHAWTALIQRFENTINYRNFPGNFSGQSGMLLCDHTDDKKLTALVRRMRNYNPIPNQLQHGPGYRNIGLRMVIEDPVFRESDKSQFIQAVDMCAYLLQQQNKPSKFIKKKGGHNYFNRLSPICCAVASQNTHGIVRL